MTDRSIRITQQGPEWLVEKNGQAPEKLGSDPQVARDQIMQFLDQYMPNQPKPIASEPAEPAKPADDAETTPTTKAKNAAPNTARSSGK